MAPMERFFAAVREAVDCGDRERMQQLLKQARILSGEGAGRVQDTLRELAGGVAALREAKEALDGAVAELEEALDVKP